MSFHGNDFISQISSEVAGSIEVSYVIMTRARKKLRIDLSFLGSCLKAGLMRNTGRGYRETGFILNKIPWSKNETRKLVEFIAVNSLEPANLREGT